MVRLDLRTLAAPEPMERILDCLRTLRRGERLVALTPLYPAPLLPILDQWGFAYRVRDADAGSACIAICHVADRHALEPPQAA
ncbi:SirA-like protein [Pseudoxanthomonas sp. KAs_5_3]|nr:SirA-like protein [Pseudoxanthomonas sp. KAs_5_3]